jgi:ABC-type transport system substrate-binding protein
MKQLTQSAGVLLCLVVLVILTTLNTFQVNNLEDRIIATGDAVVAIEKAIDELERTGVPTRAGAPLIVSSDGELGAEGLVGCPMPADEARASADPDNVLSPRTRCYQTGEPAVEGSLNLQLGQDPQGLNPYIASGSDMIRLLRHTSNNLAQRQIDSPGVFWPELAISVKSINDGMGYEVTLREGVLWHEPAVDWSSGRYEWMRGDHELTSDDYALVFEMFENDQIAGRIAGLRNYFENVESFEVIDRYTFRVNYTEYAYTSLPMLMDLKPAPRWLLMKDEDGLEFDEATWGLKINEHWYNQKAMGTGSYRFVKWEPGVQIVLEKNERFWGEEPSFESVTLQILKDQLAWVRQLKTGELHLSQIQPEQYRTEVKDNETGVYLKNPSIQHDTYNTMGYFYVGWNSDQVLFGDKRVRRAMTMAMNREGIVENVFHGLGDVTTGPFPQQHDCYDDSVEPWPYDLEQAAALLEEAGWKDLDGDGIREREIAGELIQFEFPMLIYGSSTEWATLASIYREDLLSIGVRMNPQAVEWSTMLKRMEEREFSAYSGAWVLGWDVDLHQLWHSSEADRPSSSNRIGFRNPEADVIIEKLRAESDEDKRTKLCHAFHELLHEEQPYTFVYQRRRPVLYSDVLNKPEFALEWPHQDWRYWSFKAEPGR